MIRLTERVLGLFDTYGESGARLMARRTGRRSVLSWLGTAALGGAMLPVLPFDRTGSGTARAQAEKMFLGSFNLDDFLRLLRQIRGMGSMKDILGMIPGIGQQMAGMPVDEQELPRTEAILLSMTPFERYHPEVLNTSRRSRIAAGAGVTLESVNDALRGFKEMKQQFSAMRKMGVLGNLLDPTRKLKKEKERELERMKKMGVNLFDPTQVRAYRQFSERKARLEARRNKRRKRG